MLTRDRTSIAPFQREVGWSEMTATKQRQGSPTDEERKVPSIVSGAMRVASTSSSLYSESHDIVFWPERDRQNRVRESQGDDEGKTREKRSGWEKQREQDPIYPEREESTKSSGVVIPIE